MKRQKKTSKQSQKLPLSYALGWIAISTMLISGSAALALGYYKTVSNVHQHDSKYNIVAIVQTSPEAEGLRNGYLAELLDLSVDRPSNLYNFDTKEAVGKLLSCPVICDATIRKIRPGTLHIDYKMRKPIAYLADFTNAAIDDRGVLFPFKPFYTPKVLPEIYLGVEEGGEGSVAGGAGVKGKRFDLALAILRTVEGGCCDENSTLVGMDLSNAFAASYGQRQIVLEFEDRTKRLVGGHPIVDIQKRILRLAPDNYKQQFANYLVLRGYLRQNTPSQQVRVSIIDLRLSELAFISYE